MISGPPKCLHSVFWFFAVVPLISQWHRTDLCLYIGLRNGYPSAMLIALWKDVCFYLCVCCVCVSKCVFEGSPPPFKIWRVCSCARVALGCEGAGLPIAFSSRSSARDKCVAGEDCVMSTNSNNNNNSYAGCRRASAML